MISIFSAFSALSGPLLLTMQSIRLLYKIELDETYSSSSTFCIISSARATASMSPDFARALTYEWDGTINGQLGTFIGQQSTI